MTARTYRVRVSGQFAGLAPAHRSQLCGRQAIHDVLVSAFTWDDEP